MRRGTICALIAAATFAVFSRTGGNEFLHYDDAQYFVANPHIAGGLSMKAVRWAFTDFYAYNWHPLTWISHMLDRDLFGSSPRGPHLVNALIHAASAALLFSVLGAMTGASAAAAFVAAAFALHPLHVQSVAWAAERKDVLSAFFWFAAMGAWLRYARRPGAGRYLFVAAFFVFGLLSKAMVVTLPLVLLLLDFWPLGRVRLFPGGHSATGGDAGRKSLRRLILEKIPLLILSTAVSVLAFRAQAAGGAIHHEIPLLLRAENAVVSLVIYIGKAAWPSRLAILYPYPTEGIQAWQLAGALLLLLAVALATVRRWRQAPWAAAGWGWYLVTLLPVIGIIQVGNQALADRYTYLPLTGIFLAAAWSGGDVTRRVNRGRVLTGAACCVLLATWAAGTWMQIGYWKDSVTLFTHSLAVTSDNADARYQLGHGLLREGRFAEALIQLQRSVALNQNDQHALNDLGLALSRAGRRGEAIGTLRRALQISPSYVDPYMNLGMTYLSMGDHAAAQAVLRELQAVEPAAAERLAVFIGPRRAQ